jgi:phage shock protein A
MGLIDRILRVIRANINSLVGRAEDPEKILEQAVEDMQHDLIQLRMAVAQAIATQKRTERQCSQNQATAEEWYRRAQLALQKGDDELARQALTKRKSYQETAEAMQAQLEQQSSVVNKLKQDMRLVEGKISEAKTKKDMYIARARSAQATQRLQEMLGNVSTGSSLGAFERMEEKVLQLEAQSEAIAQLGTDDLEKKFLTLEDSGDIEAELASMKAQMLTGTDPAKLPSSQESTAKDPTIDGEL